MGGVSMEWKELQTLVKRKIGYGIVQPGPSVQKGVPIIKVNNIISGLCDTKHLDKTTVENDAKYQRTKLKGGELIVTVVGTCGKTAIVPPQFVGCNLVRATCLIDIEDETICRWIKYYIDSPQGQAYINRNLNTTVQATLNVKNLNEMPLPFYSKEYTSNVVKILSSLDRKIELNNKINADLEEMAQAIFKNWFVDFEPFKDGKFVDSELGMIPEGWKVGRLTDVIKLMPGGTPKTSEPLYWDNGTIPFFSPKDVSGVYCFETEKHITEAGLNKCSSNLYPKDTIFITCRGTVGKVCLTACDMAMNQSNYAIKAIDGYSQYYVYYLVKSVVERLIKKSNGAVFSAITSKDFDEEILIPSQKTVEDFTNVIDGFFRRIFTLGTENSRLSTLRDTLLPRLMSGELEVPE